jgi:hypothetical protein
MRKKTVAVIGAHGLYSNYGGWDQLLINLAENKQNQSFNYLIFNSNQAPRKVKEPEGVKVKFINLKSSGFQGLFFDFISILQCYFKVDTLLLLGVQGIPLIAILSIFKRVEVVSNMGGIEWERPKFSWLAKMYLRFCFNLSLFYSKCVILDNEHYKVFVKDKFKDKCKVVPYGGVIDETLIVDDQIRIKYPFIEQKYFLSISRSLSDNMLDELCAVFSKRTDTLVLISNFTNSEYGTEVLEKYKNASNLILINGLYHKPELDLVRRKCFAYIHTHTLCGTAPSLVEMIVAKRPVISIDIPQNKFTLDGHGSFFTTFTNLNKVVDEVLDSGGILPPDYLLEKYEWKKVVAMYENVILN